MGERESMKALVLGYGSIGERHARLLVEKNCSVAVVSRRSIDHVPHYSELNHALSDWHPEYVVVADRTSEHRRAIESLVEFGFKGRVLIEKPLFDGLSVLPRHSFSLAAVAYNLRCHPLLTKLKSLLEEAKALVSANIYVGSFLPNWRPNTDYRQSYSAKREQGGGVLRDLSHELDYALWLFGSWRRMTASGGRFSHLEIESDDSYSLLMETQHCPLVTIHMNYLDRVPRREIIVNTDQHTVRVDLTNNTLWINGVQESLNMEQVDTYGAEHQAMLAGHAKGLCTLEDAMETLETIEAAERAATSHTWISR
jgi:predicted dehydrogenase